MMSVIIESYGLLIILPLKTITGCLYITPAQTFIGRLCLKKGEQSVFDLIDYNITDAVVTFEEGVYAENVMTKIRMDAAKYGKPVISVGVEHDDCISIKFGYAKGFEQVVRHVIEQHGVRDIGFIAGRKDEENSEERTAVFRKLLEEYDIPFRNDVFYYGDYWSVPALKAVDDMIEKK